MQKQAKPKLAVFPSSVDISVQIIHVINSRPVNFPPSLKQSVTLLVRFSSIF